MGASLGSEEARALMTVFLLGGLYIQRPLKTHACDVQEVVACNVHTSMTLQEIKVVIAARACLVAIMLTFNDVVIEY